MDSDDFICNIEGIPDTHYFIYKSKKYPIKYDFFKYASKYFQNHHEEIQRNPNIQLIDENSHLNYELTDETIADFIKFVQCNQIKLTRENVVGLNYLSTVYEIPSLKKHTEEYIKKNHQLIVVELLQKNETNETIDKENCEEIIATHLEEYIQDERLLTLKIPTLYRILTKYNQKNTQNQISKEIIEFLFKILSKYGREASILFSEVDFGDARIDCVNRLLTEFSTSFDFHFINSTLLQTLYDANGEILRREEEHRKEIERLNLEIKRIEKIHQEEISKQKVETQKLVADVKKELMDEINKLQKQLKNQTENQEQRLNEQKINEEKQKNSLANEIKLIKDEIKLMKQDKERKEREERERKERERKEREEREERGIPLRLKEDEEFNGIIKYLTDLTKGNIHDNKTIEVTTSSKKTSAKNILDFNCDSYYEAEPRDDLWICFDFKNRKVKVTNYSIKSHRQGVNIHQLKSWKIEVSNDGKTWIKIDEHTDCATLNGSCITGTFSANQNDFSRYVRLHQTGRPWGGHDLWFHYIEFYGYLKEP